MTRKENKGDKTTATEVTEKDKWSGAQMKGGGGGSPIYGLGMIGAGIYYWRRADPGTGEHAKAIGKAFVWPAFLVYDLLRHLEGDPKA